MNDLLNIDVVRRCALRWPLTAQLDKVATERNPVLRCVIVAKVIEPVQDDPVLGDLADATIGALRDEARRRHAGGGPAMPSLTQPRPPQRPQHSKERSFA